MNLVQAFTFILVALGVNPAQGADLVSPEVLESRGNTLDIELTLEYGNHETDVHTLTNTRLFNGQLPGPTLKIKAGDKMKILFKNNLVEQPDQNTVTNEFSYPDSSNLHFHGAHVSGELPSDDVTMKVHPGEKYQYIADFPANHMPGTHWIHPHAHGSGALQVGGGAAMALIVEDPVGYLPEQVANAKDVLLFVQHMQLEELEKVASASRDSKLEITKKSEDIINYRLVNGQYQPTVHMKTGEWQRWRIVYGAWLGDALNFAIDDNACEMQLLAKDGLYIQDFPRLITSAPIPTAGRADIMVRCHTAGDYTVSDFGGTLLNIKVKRDEGDDLVSWKPKDLPQYLEDLTKEEAPAECSCSTSFGRCTDGGSCVNDLKFDADRFLHTVAYGSIIERELSGLRVHPYHQHVYPFQIVGGLTDLEAGGEQATYFKTGDWHDVLMIEGLGFTTAITMRYQPKVHLGRIMVHCHRLQHEDQGMMGQEEVVDHSPCECEANGGRTTAAPKGAPKAPKEATKKAPKEAPKAPKGATKAPKGAAKAKNAPVNIS